MELRERIMKDLSNTDERFFDETVSCTLMDFYSENGEFTKDELEYLNNVYNFDNYDVFQLVAPEEQLHSDDIDCYFERFVSLGYCELE